MTLKWNLYEPVGIYLDRNSIHLIPTVRFAAMSVRASHGKPCRKIQILNCCRAHTALAFLPLRCRGAKCSMRFMRPITPITAVTLASSFKIPSRLARHIVAMSEPIARCNGEFRIVDFGGGNGAIARVVGNLVADRTCRSILVQVIDYGDAPKSREGAVEMHFFRDLSSAATECGISSLRAARWNMSLILHWLPALVGKLRSGGLFMRALHTFCH